MISICMLRVSIFREKCGCLHLQFTVTSKNTVFSTSNPMDTRKSFQNISEALLGMTSVRMRSSEFRHYFSTPTSLWSVSVYLNVWPVRQSLSLTCLIFDLLLVFVIWYLWYWFRCGCAHPNFAIAFSISLWSISVSLKIYLTYVWLLICWFLI